MKLDFDVNYDFSLEQLKQELVPLCTHPSTKVLFNLSGPGSGNTQVLVETESNQDMDNFLNYLLKHQYDMGAHIPTKQ